MQIFRAVILDVDGTLVNSNDAHARAWINAFSENGIHTSYERVRRLIGMGGDKLIPEVARTDKDTPLGKRIDKRRSEIFKERYLPSLSPTPGAHALLEHMQAVKLQLAVASSAKKDELKSLLRVCGGEFLMDRSTSSDDAEQSKPDPDIIHAALELLNLPHEEVVMLGDTPYDLEAAHRAGIGFIGVRSGGWKDSELQGALAVFSDPADLLAHFDQSPLAQSKFADVQRGASPRGRSGQ